MKTARRISRQIAKQLFTNGMKERAERLKLVQTINGKERDLGGWCEEAAVDRIEETLAPYLNEGRKLR